MIQHDNDNCFPENFTTTKQTKRKHLQKYACSMASVAVNRSYIKLFMDILNKIIDLKEQEITKAMNHLN